MDRRDKPIFYDPNVWSPRQVASLQQLLHGGFRIDPNAPDNTIAIIPPRQNDEPEDAWLARCIMIHNLAAT